MDIVDKKLKPTESHQANVDQEADTNGLDQEAHPKTKHASAHNRKIELTRQRTDRQITDVFFNIWKSGFGEYSTHVSSNDLAQAGIKTHNSIGIGLLNGIPHKFASNDTVKQGHFFNQLDFDHEQVTTERVTLSKCSFNTVYIATAFIKINKLQSTELSEDERIYIPPKELSSIIKNTLDGVPVQEDQQFCCSMNVTHRKQATNWNLITITLTFTVNGVNSGISDTDSKFFLINKDSKFSFTSETGNIIFGEHSNNGHELIVRGDLNGINSIQVDSSMYGVIRRDNPTQPVLKSNGYYFSVMPTDKKIKCELFKCNSSLSNLIKPFDLAQIEIINEQLPTATDVHLKLRPFEENKDVGDIDTYNKLIKLQRGPLPSDDVIKSSILKEIKKIPLQQGGILQILVPLDTNSYALLEATITSVSGESTEANRATIPAYLHQSAGNIGKFPEDSDPLRDKELRQQNTQTAFWGSDDTQIHLTRPPELAVEIQLTPQENDSQSKTTYFTNWDSEYMNNGCLVSHADLKKLRIKTNDTSVIAQLNGVAYKIIPSDKVNTGCILYPPFFMHAKSQNKKITLSPCSYEKEDIESAHININEIQRDEALQDKKIEIPIPKLLYKIKKHLAEVPLQEDQQYYCNVNIYYNEFGKRFSACVNILFSLKDIKPDISAKTILVLNKKMSRLSFHSEIDGITFCEFRDDFLQLETQHSHLLNGTNAIQLDAEIFYSMKLNNEKKPVIKIGNFFFSATQKNNQLLSNYPGYFSTNQSFIKMLASYRQYSIKAIHSPLPTASEVHIKLELFHKINEEKKSDELFDPNAFPSEAVIKNLIRYKIKTTPLQRQGILQFHVPLKTGSSGILLEGTITAVRGGDKECTEQNELTAFLGSDDTGIHLTMADELICEDKDYQLDQSIVETLNTKVGGVSKQINQIMVDVILPRVLSQHNQLKLSVSSGIILYGPTGTGKTTCAKALAEVIGCKSNDIRVIKGPELLGKYLGDSEKAIRKLFTFQSNSDSLKVVILDEIESLLGDRENLGPSATKTRETMITQFLSCLDGTDKSDAPLIIGTTNHLNKIDSAVKRVGRLGHHYKIDLPDEDGRKEIMKILIDEHSVDTTLTENDYSLIARKTVGKSGADLKGIVEKSLIKSIIKVEGLNINSLRLTDLKKMNIDQCKINLEIILDALNEFNDVSVKISCTLDEYLPATGPFYNLDCQGYREISDSDVCNNVWSVQQYINKTASKSENGACGAVLITGESETGKTRLARKLVEGASFTHLEVINASELSINHDIAQQSIKQSFDNCKSSERSVIVINDIDQLPDSDFYNPSLLRRTLLQHYSREKKSIRNRSFVMLATSREIPVNLDSWPLRFNRKIKLDKLGNTDMTTILNQMNTKTENILEIVNMFSDKIPIGDFLNLTGRNYSTETDGTIRWDLEDLKDDIAEFYKSQREDSTILYS